MAAPEQEGRRAVTQQIQTGRTVEGKVLINIPAKVFEELSTEQDVQIAFTAAQARNIARQLDDLAWMVISEMPAQGEEQITGEDVKRL